MYTEGKETLSPNVVDNLPDFGRILDCLEKEGQYGQENTMMLRRLANIIKPVEDQKNIDKEDPLLPEPSCLVNCLWREINRIQKNNNDMHEVIIHLQRVVGV